MTPLADALLESAQALSADVHVAMYRDPFWMERFGERGARFSREDGVHHVKYLADALRFEQPSLLSDYAVWLRGVLTSRGMCTLHLDETLACLADAIDARGIEGATLARGVIDSARRALAYPEGEALAIQRAADTLSARLVAGSPDDAPILGEAQIRRLISYAADAVAKGDDRGFVEHVTWLRDSLVRRGIAGARFDALLLALEEAGGPESLGRLCALGMESAP
ncbi:MAG: hypothetical protein U0414_16640 [Polyangiaceae bacterium]